MYGGRGVVSRVVSRFRNSVLIKFQYLGPKGTLRGFRKILNEQNPSRNKVRRRQNKNEWDDASDAHDVHNSPSCGGMLMSLMPSKRYVNVINALQA